MISPPTDRLYKFAAIGGLALALGGGAGALRQYHETGLQEAEFFGSVAKLGSVYSRFATQAREQIAREQKLKSSAISAGERAALEKEVESFRSSVPSFDKEFEEAKAGAQRQEAVARHFRRMQAIWLVLAGVALTVRGVVSYRGFKVWRSSPAE
jgi:hypothetical protein